MDHGCDPERATCCVLVIVTNGHTENLKDFTIACDAIGNSGSVIETVRSKLYEEVDHGKSLVVQK